MKRQQRKLNFLITQTELYAHFMARKLTGATDAERDAILQRFDEPATVKPRTLISGVIRTALDDDYGTLVLIIINQLLLICSCDGRRMFYLYLCLPPRLPVHSFVSLIKKLSTDSYEIFWRKTN